MARINGSASANFLYFRDRLRLRICSFNQADPLRSSNWSRAGKDSGNSCNPANVEAPATIQFSSILLAQYADDIGVTPGLLCRVQQSGREFCRTIAFRVEQQE